MAGEQTDIQLLISAKDQASQALKKISGEATRVGRELDKARANLKRTGEGAADVKRLEAEFRRLNGDVKRYNTALGQTARAQRQVQTSGSSMARVLAGVGFAELARQAVLNASALEDAASASTAVLGDQAAAVQDFAQQASDAYGLSERAALQAATNFASMGKAAGLSGAELSEFGVQLTERAADLASFWGTDQQTAIDALRSGLAGESEPLKRFGIFLDDATLKAEAMRQGLIETTNQALTPQSKVLAASALIFDQNSDSIGDYARTQESAANSIKTAQAEYENLSATMGQELLPVVVEILKPIGALADLIEDLPDGAVATALAMGATAFAARRIGPAMTTAAAGMRAARIEQGLLRSTAGGAAGVLGGPWGIALTAGIGLLTLFASRSDEATTSQSNYGAQLGETAEALKLRQAQTAATTLADNGAIAAAEDLGVSSAQLIRAVLDEGSAREQVNDTIARAQFAYDQLNNPLLDAADGSKDYTDISKEEANAVRDAAAAADALKAALDPEAAAFDKTSSAAEAAEKALDGVGAGAEDTRTDIERLTAVLDPLTNALDRLSGEAQLAESFANARRELREFVKGTDGAGRNITFLGQEGRDAFRSLIDPIQTAEAEAKRLLEAGDISPEKATAKVRRVYEQVLGLADQLGIGGQKVRALQAELERLKSREIDLIVDAEVNVVRTTVVRERIGGPIGDTATARGVDMPGGAVGAFHAALAGTTPGSFRVTSGIRDYALGSPNSDHLHGRAYDLVGSNLAGYKARVEGMGGLADYHGTGQARHLHVVPFTKGGGQGGAPVTMTNHFSVAQGVDVEAAMHRAFRTQARLEERRARRSG